MIKKFTLVVAFAFLAISTVSAQVEKGKVLIGGKTSLSYTSSTFETKYDGTSYGKTTVSNFQLAPTIGYFVMDGLAIGLDLSFTSQKYKDDGDSWSDPQTLIGAQLFGKYFMGSTNFKPFGKAKVGFVSQSSSPDDADKDSGLALGFEVGGAYFLNESVALEMGFGYDYAKLKNKDDSKLTNELGALGINFGIAITF